MTATAARAEPVPAVTRSRGPSPATLGWGLLLGLTSLFSFVWLGLGAVIALAASVPGLADPAAGGGGGAAVHSAIDAS